MAINQANGVQSGRIIVAGVGAELASFLLLLTNLVLYAFLFLNPHSEEEQVKAMLIPMGYFAIYGWAFLAVIFVWLGCRWVVKSLVCQRAEIGALVGVIAVESNLAIESTFTPHGSSVGTLGAGLLALRIPSGFLAGVTFRESAILPRPPI